MSNLWAIYCIVFVAVILTVQALWRLIAGAQGRSAAIKRRLALSAGGGTQGEPVDILREERGLANWDHPRFARLNEFLAQTGLRISGFALGVWAVSIGAVLALALSPFLSPFGPPPRSVPFSVRWRSPSICRSLAEGGSIGSPPNCLTRSISSCAACELATRW